ncbi:hypothetical protein NQZ68_004106 [Dissostichus eleginoides]|nr:hypothetical protein NQZ68_004106 [Dissostichus eleginoides]
MAEAQNDYATKRRGVHLSAPNKDTIHLPVQLSYSTVKSMRTQDYNALKLLQRQDVFRTSAVQMKL